MDRNQNIKPGEKVYNQNLQPGEVGYVEPMQGQQSTTSSGLQPGQQGYQQGLQPGQQGYQQGLKPGQQGYQQGLQPGQPGYQQGLQPGQSQTTGQSIVNKMEGMLPGQANREQTATTLENQPGQQGYQQGLQPGQQGYQQGLQPGQQGYQQGLQPGQQGYQQGLQPGQQGYQQGLQPGQQGYQQGLKPGQPGYQQGLQPGQPGYQQGLQPGQSQTTGQSIVNKMEGMLPGQANREQTATTLENQPGQQGYQQGLQPGQQGYQQGLQPGQQQGLQPGQQGYQQGLKPGQPGYQQGLQPGQQQGLQPGQQQGLQPGQQQGLQPGQPGYQQGLQPGQPGYQQGLQPGYQQGLKPGQQGYQQGLQPGQQGYQQGLQPGQPGYNANQPAGQGLGQAIGQSVSHAFGSSPMPGQSSYVQGQNLPSQQQGIPSSSSSSSSAMQAGYGGQPSYGPPSNLGFGRPTVFPTQNFNANADAERLRTAIKGAGTDNAVLIDIFGSRTSLELKQIDAAYKTMFGSMLMKDIDADLKLSGGFSKIVNYRFFTLAEFDAHNVHKSVTGARTDENALIETFTTRNNQQIKEAAEAYRRIFSRDMEKDVVGDTSGNFRNLMTSLIQANRDESGRVDPNAAIADANTIYNSGEGRWGTDDLTLNTIFATRSFSQLKLIFDEYSRVSKYDIEQSIDKEMSGNLKLAMLSIVRSARDRPAFFAERLYNAMKGLGSDERTINRIICSRCEIDLEDVKQAFNLKYNKDLSKSIEADSKGDYQRILLQLLGNYRTNVVH